MRRLRLLDQSGAFKPCKLDLLNIKLILKKYALSSPAKYLPLMFAQVAQVRLWCDTRAQILGNILISFIVIVTHCKREGATELFTASSSWLFSVQSSTIWQILFSSLHLHFRFSTSELTRRTGHSTCSPPSWSQPSSATSSPSTSSTPSSSSPRSDTFRTRAGEILTNICHLSL